MPVGQEYNSGITRHALDGEDGIEEWEVQCSSVIQIVAAIL
jgi:hypothetical protein